MKSRLLEEFRERLQDGTPSMGTWLQIASLTTCEICCKGNFDWIVVDMEHGEQDRQCMREQLMVIELSEKVPIVRLGEKSEKGCKDALDGGALGLIYPNVKSDSELGMLLEWSLWPPAGKRGVGLARCNEYGTHFDEYSEIAQRPIVGVQIEHIDALEEICKMSQRPEVDFFMLGPYDMSASLGCPGSFDASEYIDAVNRFSVCVEESNKAKATHLVHPTKDSLEKLMADGYSLIAYSVDSVMLRKAVDGLA